MKAACAKLANIDAMKRQPNEEREAMALFANRTAAQPQAPAAAPMQPAPPPARQNYDQPRRAAPSNIYDGIENEKDERRSYIDGVGEYLLEVIQISDGVLPEGVKNAGAPFFGADFNILESNNPEFPAGSEGSWMTTLGRFPKYFRRDINSFMSATCNVAPTEVTAASIQEATSEANPAAGFRVRLSVKLDPRGGVNEKTGKPYTVKTFRPA